MDIPTYEFLRSRFHTLMILITMISGWGLIFGGCFWLSRSLSYQHFGSMFPIYYIIDPYYSYSLLVASIGLVVLGVMHVFIFLKFNNKISLSTTFFMILAAYLISLRAFDRLSIIEYENISNPYYVYPYFFSLIFGFGLEGFTYLSLRRYESIFSAAGVLTLFMGIILSMILVSQMPVDICTIILVIVFIFPLISFIKLYKKELHYPISELWKIWRSGP